MNYIGKQISKPVLTLFFLFFCSQLQAAPILFDFEAGDEINPVLTKDGLTLTHSSILPDISQLVTDSRSVPFEGNGSMRLSYADFGNAAVTARVDFSSLLSEVSLWALNLSPSTATYTISALSATDTILSTLSVDTDALYTSLEFSGVGPISALQFSSSSVNNAYWDNLTAIVIPTNNVPAPEILSLLFVSVIFVIRRRSLSK